MERLTERDEFGNANIVEVDSAEFQLSLDFDDFNRVTYALNKLAEYEDFEEIFRSKMTDSSCDFLKDKEEFARWIDRNRWIAKKCDEYARAEEQGKLLKLPCAVGDTVYHLCTLKNGKSEIIEMTVGCVEPYGAIRNHKGIYEVWNVYAETDYTKGYFKFFDFGKTVFLSREEAEATLKELEEG